MTFAEKFYAAFFEADRWMWYLQGLGNTLLITLGAIAIGTVLGAILCLMKSSDHKLLSVPSRIYIDVIRGTPVMVQLLVMSLVVFTSRDANKLLVAILAFGMNSGAYVAEIFRSGIASVDAGQMEAGRSLGLSKAKTMQKIIFPQAIKNCLPTYASEFIVLVKETAVAGTIGIMDLTKVYSTVQSRTYDATAPLLIIVVMYFAVTKLLSILFAYMERRLRESDKR
ncbi:MAG: amino acid ABC transporter permease [Oscillospiraceae bacterium]